MMHFDICYIGKDFAMWSHLNELAEIYSLTVLNIKNTNEIAPVSDDFSFTVVLTELHIDYNYEGFAMFKSGLKYSFVGILTDELNERSISISDSLFRGEPGKYLLLKDIESIDSFLNIHPIHMFESKNSQVVMEA